MSKEKDRKNEREKGEWRERKKEMTVQVRA